MKILVFVKQVPDTEALVEAGNDGKLKIENKYEISFFDSLAIEEALKLKEKHGGTVTAVSAGPQRADEVLKTCLALGADSVYRIWDERLVSVFDNSVSDPLVIAHILKSAAEHIGFDIILCGKQALDDDAAAVGVMTAALLRIPFVTAVKSVEIENNSIKALKEQKGMNLEIKCSLPALLTAEKGLNEPRQPQVMRVMKAARAKIDILDLGTLKTDIDKLKPAFAPVSFSVPDKARKVKMIEGEPGDAAAELIKHLREERQIL